MIDIPRDVPAFEHGRLRLWSFDGDAEKGRTLVEALSAEPRNAGPAQELLGAARVDPYWLDLVRLRDLSELGLAGYLRQGYDVEPSGLGVGDLPTGHNHVLIAPSRAFADRKQTLAPDPLLHPLAVIDLAEDVGSLRSMDPVASARSDAEPEAAPAASRPGPPAGRGLRPTAILIMVLIAAAFIALVAF